MEEAKIVPDVISQKIEPVKDLKPAVTQLANAVVNTVIKVNQSVSMEAKNANMNTTWTESALKLGVKSQNKEDIILVKNNEPKPSNAAVV